MGAPAQYQNGIWAPPPAYSSRLKFEGTASLKTIIKELSICGFTKIGDPENRHPNGRIPL